MSTRAKVPIAGVIVVAGLIGGGLYWFLYLPLEAQLVDDTVVLVGSLDISFADYGVEAPTSIIALSVEDQGVLELQFLLTPG